MLENTDITVIAYTLLGFFLILRIIEWRMGRKWTPIKKAFLSFKVLLFMTGAVILTLIFCLPTTSHLGSYDYPEGFKSFAEIDRYMKENTRVLERMKDIISFLLYILAAGVLQSLYMFATALEKSKTFDGSAKYKVLNLE